MNLTLVIGKQGDKESKTILFNLARVSIGRTDGEILVKDARCSRLHASLFQGVDGALYIRDFGSRNGTWVDGKRVVEQKLEVGQEVRIASLVFRVIEYTAHSEFVRGWPNLYECFPKTVDRTRSV